MGCFGYICKGCGTPINGSNLGGGESCVMIHMRHGKELGRVEGHYDEYGRVAEQEHLPEAEKYRGNHDGPNGHREICDSEFSMEDSYYRLEALRLYQGEEADYERYAILKALEWRKKACYWNRHRLKSLTMKRCIKENLPRCRRL